MSQVSLKKFINILTKFTNSGRIDNIFIFVLLCMFLLVKVTGVYFINETKNHIDDLVWLYNQTKNSSLILFSGSYHIYRGDLSKINKRCKHNINKKNIDNIDIYPVRLIPYGLIYGTIVRTIMSPTDCDNYNQILQISDLNERIRMLKIKRVNIAVTPTEVLLLL